MNEHERILAEWKSRANGRGTFIFDGIFDPGRWESTEPKILFVLKEACNDEIDVEDWDLTKDESVRSSVAFREAGYWAYCVLNNILSPESVTRALAEDALLRTATINVKKISGIAYASNDELKSHVDEFGDLLLRQIDAINPTFVICGYTWWLLNKLVPKTRKVSEVVRMTDEGRVFVNFWHPSNRFPRLMNCVTLVSSLREGGQLGNAT